MPLSSQTLAALQLAGATIYQADLELKDAVQAYGNQVRAAMTANPFEMRNDGLFEEWKAVARMSQAVAQIETEFKKIFIQKTRVQRNFKKKIIWLLSLNPIGLKIN